MKHLRRFNENNESNIDIQAICQRYGITNYTINEDVSIDVNGSVDLSYKKLTKIPLKFRNVTGYFSCHNNQLTTLEGGPQSVEHFNCNNNKLTSLEGSPQSVGGGFYCSNNQLTSLEGSPRTVGGSFHCSNNELTTLEGAPQSVGGAFYCPNNQLVNLDFTPSCKILNCNSNPINKWLLMVNDISKLDAFIDLGIDSRDPDFMNKEKIDLLNE